MKCYIVRDILPLYCDNLTSKASNEEILKHLHDCENCNTIFKNMNKKQEEIKIIEKDINPLKKVNKRNKCKVGMASFITFAIMAAFSQLILIATRKNEVENEKNI